MEQFTQEELQNIWVLLNRVQVSGAEVEGVFDLKQKVSRLLKKEDVKQKV